MLWVWIPIRARCTTLCDKVCQWLATGRWFSPGIPVSSTNKTDCHVITEILLKVVLNTINQTKPTTYPHKPSFCVHKGLQKLVGSFIDPWLDMMQKSNMAVTAGHSTFACVKCDKWETWNVSQSKKVCIIHTKRRYKINIAFTILYINFTSLTDS
jgi:hypothetical protein